MSKSPALPYRRDIDGIRAIAVTSVVLYHAGIWPFSGGYIGVDIFYVISGYLITGIIVNDLHKDRFSILGFYDRRIRRIFPALFVMTIFTSIVSWFVLLPVEFKEYGESLTAMSFFASNVYFYFKSGYFDHQSTLRPLLHTWSLAVEEQYYVLFPPLMMILYRINRGIVPYVCTAVWAASLAATLHEIGIEQKAAFYLPQYRAWELLTGSLLTIRLFKATENAPLAQGLSILGLAGILGPIFLYTADTQFPGAAAISPVIGTALIIYAGEKVTTTVSRLLGTPPFVFVGLLSYSFYLWHWPLFAFSRYILDRDITQVEGTALAMMAFALGYLSWRFIEPARRIKTATKRPVFAAGALCILIGAAFGATGRIGNGLPSRLPSEVARIGMVALDINPNRNSCDSRSPARLDADAVCRIGDKFAPISFALIGDSFGDSFVPGVDAIASERQKAGYVLTRAGCVPLFGTSQDAGACKQFLDAVERLIARHPEIKTVILIGRWTSVSEGSRFGSDKLDHMFVSDDQTASESYEENRRVMRRGFDRTLSALAGRKVFITAFIPEQAVDVPRSIAMKRWFGVSENIGIDRATFDRRQAFTRALLAADQKKFHFSVVDVGAALCDQERCRASENGFPIYVDDNHLSRTEVTKLKQLFAVAFR